MSYKAPQRAGLLIEETSKNLIFIPFILNPEELSDSEDINYAIHEIPGFADPWVQYVSGRGRKISFMVKIEIERIREMVVYQSQKGRLETVIKGSDGIVRTPSLDIAENLKINKFSSVALSRGNISQIQTLVPDTVDLYIEQLRRLVLPRENENYIQKAPPNVVLLFGATTMRGKIIEWKAQKKFFNDGLETEYAEINITMIRNDAKVLRFYTRYPSRAQGIQVPFSDADVNNLRPVNPKGGYRFK